MSRVHLVAPHQRALKFGDWGAVSSKALITRLVIVEPNSLTALPRAGTNLPLLGELVGLTFALLVGNYSTKFSFSI